MVEQGTHSPEIPALPTSEVSVLRGNLLQIAKHAKSEKTTQDTQAVLPGTSGLWLLTT